MNRYVLSLVFAPLVACTIFDDPDAVTINSVDMAVDMQDMFATDMSPDGMADDMTSSDQGIDLAIDSGPQTIVFSDDGTSGSHQNTQWTGQLKLNPDAAQGLFTSRVFDAGENANWTSIAWTPAHPYGLDLDPSRLPTELVYPAAGQIKRDNLSVLLAFEGSGAVQNSDPVTDSSGNDVPTSAAITVGSTYEPGVFGSAIAVADEDYVEIQSTHPVMQFGTGDLTWALFARTGPCVGDNNVFIGGDDLDTHMWMGCGTSETSCPNGTGLAGYFYTDDGIGDGICTSGKFDDDAWHHLAVTITGHENATVRFWVDGVVVGLQTLNYEPDGEFNFAGTNNVFVGSFPIGTYYSTASFDELTLWRRALSENELQAIALRGLANVGLQMRVCEMPDCSDDPEFRSGTGDSWIQDPLSGGLPRVETTGFTGRYAQYRVELSGPGTISPGVRDVTLEAVPSPSL